jgi:hypothetical protein
VAFTPAPASRCAEVSAFEKLTVAALLVAAVMVGAPLFDVDLMKQATLFANLAADTLGAR